MKKSLNQSYTFGTEQATLAMLLIIFESDYLIRYVYDETQARMYDLPDEEQWSMFQVMIYPDLVYLLDGVCFLSFMLMHRSNMKG